MAEHIDAISPPSRVDGVDPADCSATDLSLRGSPGGCVGVASRYRASTVFIAPPFASQTESTARTAFFDAPVTWIRQKTSTGPE